MLSSLLLCMVLGADHQPTIKRIETITMPPQFVQLKVSNLKDGEVAWVRPSVVHVDENFKVWVDTDMSLMRYLDDPQDIYYLMRIRFQDGAYHIEVPEAHVARYRSHFTWRGDKISYWTKLAPVGSFKAVK